MEILSAQITRNRNITRATRAASATNAETKHLIVVKEIIIIIETATEAAIETAIETALVIPGADTENLAEVIAERYQC